MEAARRLRKSYNNTNKFDFIKIDNKLKNKYKEKVDIKFKLGFKSRFFLKTIFVCLILFFCIIINFFFYDNIKDNKYFTIIISNYSKDYNREQSIENIEEIFKKIDEATIGFIPNKFKNYISNKYVTNIKNYVLDFDFKNKFNLLFNSKSNNIYIYDDINIYEEKKEIKIYTNIEEVSKNNQNNKKFDGKGGAEEIEISSITSDTEDVLKLNETSFIIPVEGIITSRFGARDEIFKGVNSYHTGIDIANELNTEILSSIDGSVSKIVYNDKYYGNYILIENNKVTTKYAHLNSITVSKGDVIKQGDIIGYMGSTGLSTGSHLHFEVWYDKNKINPEKVLEFY